jgi:hypothetical protein
VLTAVWNVGRLIELRFAGSPTIDDVAQFELDSHACVASCAAQTGQPVVVCTDIRATQLFRPEVTERLIQTMRGNNRLVERNAMLGNGSALMALQIGRLTKEAAGDNTRRFFTELDPLVEWLAESLTAPEQDRVRQFLAEHETNGAANREAPTTAGAPTTTGRTPTPSREPTSYARWRPFPPAPRKK